MRPGISVSPLKLLSSLPIESKNKKDWINLIRVSVFIRRNLSPCVFTAPCKQYFNWIALSMLDFASRIIQEGGSKRCAYLAEERNRILSSGIYLLGVKLSRN